MTDKTKIYLDKIFLFLMEQFPSAQLFVFGSAVSDNQKLYHDIDIGIEDTGKIPLMKLQWVKEKIDDMNIPYKVDVIDFKRVSTGFYKTAKEKIIKWKN
ncbi:MAG: nucleotidyltransferase domain-containing protein [Bacteroidota bacterium]|nr:nucleotidyltransferase domain-containing protein [Bacteroidota bacterium]